MVKFIRLNKLWLGIFKRLGGSRLYLFFCSWNTDNLSTYIGSLSEIIKLERGDVR
jgi:hypothetical protein